MRVLLLLASSVMLVSAAPDPEAPTSYSTYSSQSSGGISFQNVPSVASLQYSAPPQQSRLSSSYSSPSQSYGAPSQQQQSQSYGAPQQQQQQPSQSYGAPQQQQPSQSYGAPGGGGSQQSSQISISYGAPSQQQQPSSSYGAPSGGGGSSSGYSSGGSQSQHPSIHSQSQPANVQISYGAPPQLPPGSSYGPPPIVTGAGPDHEIEYRVVYKPVKAPKPDLVLPPPPPKQKTIVYILVPRIEPPEPIIVPTHAPTPPSKPEVYFIRYKPAKKNKPSSSYGAPSQQYGAASAPKGVVVAAPSSSNSNKKREVVSVSKEVNEGPISLSSSIFGEKMKSSSSSSSSSSSISEHRSEKEE